MPGFANSDNLFGVSDFIVGGQIGAGCNYVSIQAAVNDAIASGNQSVYIRPGNYFENVTIGGTVALIGCSGPTRNSSVIIDGSITCTDGSISLVNLKIIPTAPGIKPLTINTGAFVQLFCENVDVDSMTTIDTAISFVAGSADVEFVDCLIRSGANAAILDDIGASVVIRGSTITCSGATACYTANGIGYQVTTESCLFESTGGEIHVSNNIGGFIARYCRFNNGTAATEAFKLNNAVSILNLAQCDVLCSAASTDWVNGVGVLNYGGVVLQSTAVNIAGTLASVTPYDWKPYATDTVKGTASFNSNQFSVTAGAVSLSGSNSSLPVFSAYQSAPALNATGDGTAATIVCDTVLINQGTGYSGVTGQFTAPSNGIYHFEYTISGSNFAAANTTGYAYLSVALGDTYYGAALNPNNCKSVTSGDLKFIGDAVINLTAGDVVSIKLVINGGALTTTVDGAAAPNISTRFAGWKIA